MGTGIYIKSDFFEDYDKYLHDPMGKLSFERLTHSGLKRSAMLKFLDEKKEDLCIDVIPHGTVQEIWDLYRKDMKAEMRWERIGLTDRILDEVIVYCSEELHRGEGKEKEYIDDAIVTYPYKYCSVHMRNEQFPESYRHLYIGNRVYYFTYYSLTDWWRSNVGDVVIYYSGSDKRELENDNFPPLFAIDFVVSENPYNYKSLAVDYNIAPKLPDKVYKRSWGKDNLKCVEKKFSEILTPEEAAKLLEEYIKKIWNDAFDPIRRDYE